MKGPQWETWEQTGPWNLVFQRRALLAHQRGAFLLRPLLQAPWRAALRSSPKAGPAVTSSSLFIRNSWEQPTPAHPTTEATQLARCESIAWTLVWWLWPWGPQQRSSESVGAPGRALPWCPPPRASAGPGTGRQGPQGSGGLKSTGPRNQGRAAGKGKGLSLKLCVY